MKDAQFQGSRSLALRGSHRVTPASRKALNEPLPAMPNYTVYEEAIVVQLAFGVVF